MSAELVRIVSEALQLPVDVPPGFTVALKGSLLNQVGHIVGEVDLQVTVTQIVDVDDQGNTVTEGQ